MVYTYNKLVRDKNVELIQNKGAEVTFEILDDLTYGQELHKKLVEEVDEYITDYSIEEMADVMEVILAILKFRGIKLTQLKNVMKEKRNRKGAFTEKVFLKQVMEG